MKNFNIEITALSPLHLGSGKADITIDAEVVHDKYGLPYFPAKRLKGLLYESALEMAEISQGEWFSADDVQKLFGQKNADISGFRIENFYLDNYIELCEAWNYLREKCPSIFTREAVLETYTDVRYQTSIDIDTGTTLSGSLHNMRVVDADTKFKGKIELILDSDVNLRILEYALKNLRFAGAKRNRGYGLIKCEILEDVVKDKENLKILNKKENKAVDTKYEKRKNFGKKPKKSHKRK